MRERPPIGARVRLRKNVGLPRFIGRTGAVVGHHPDGIAIHVRLDGDSPDKKPFTCDWPVDVSLIVPRLAEAAC